MYIHVKRLQDLWEVSLEAQITGMAEEAGADQNADRKRVATRAPRWVPPSS